MYHAEDGANQYWQSAAKISIFHWGALGVPMFFCLSGFVIAYSGCLRPKKAWELLYARLARVYPAYLATVFSFVAGLIVIPAGTFKLLPVLPLIS